MSAAEKWIKVSKVIVMRSIPPLAVAMLVPSLRRADVLVGPIGLSLWSLIEAAIEHEASNKDAVKSADDKGTRLYVLGAHMFAWWAPLVEVLVRETSMSTTAMAIGILVIAVGAFLRLYAVHALGEFFTAHVRVLSDQVVCERGPYRYVRHPSYLGLVFLNTGPAIACGAWVGAVAALVLTLIANRLRVQVEEEALLRILGNRYRSYMERLPRWIPGLRRGDSARGRHEVGRAR